MGRLRNTLKQPLGSLMRDRPRLAICARCASGISAAEICRARIAAASASRRRSSCRRTRRRRGRLGKGINALATFASHSGRNSKTAFSTFRRKQLNKIRRIHREFRRLSKRFIFSMDSPISIVRSIDEYAIFEIQYESRFGTHHDLQLGYQLAGTVGT